MGSANYKYQTFPKSTILPSKPLKMYFGRPIGEESISEDNHHEEVPLPDIVLCSVLTAGKNHGGMIRERRRHKATIQTKGRELLDEDPDYLMEPLVKDLENLDLFLAEKVGMIQEPEENEKEKVDSKNFGSKRR